MKAATTPKSRADAVTSIMPAAEAYPGIPERKVGKLQIEHFSPAGEFPVKEEERHIHSTACTRLHVHTHAQFAIYMYT